jgi:hypothetical protein
LSENPFKTGTDRRQVNRLGVRVRNLERRVHAIRFVPVVFDGGGAVLDTGVWGDVPIHFDGIIVRWRLITLDEGDLQIDIWKSDFADFPPDSSSSITGSDQPLVSGDVKNESVALTGWTTRINAGDILRFNVDSVDIVTKATLTLAIQA